MSGLMVPPNDDDPWPTLGPHVCQFIESELCYGPGDMLGRSVVLNDEQRAWIYRLYEIEPAKLTRRRNKVISRSVNPRAGRRRFERCALSLRKGSAKTELAAWIAIPELHADGPVRCDGFEKNGDPIPRPVTDPYIPMISYSEEQTEELAYGALRRILMEVSIGNDFDIGLERVLRLDGKGKCEAVSTSPNARDGARTTFQHADETHRLILDGQKRAWTVMLANLAKRPMADPWALETTTAPEPGAGSVAENTMEYARQVATGKTTNSHLFFYHRAASDDHDLTTRKGLKEAIVEASGPFISQWSDIDRIADSFEEPGADRAYLERVWLNRLVQSTGRAFSVKKWQLAARPDFVVPSFSAITLGFDGGRFDDNTALIGTHIETGHQFSLGIWEPPNIHGDMSEEAKQQITTEWVSQVDAAVTDAFARFFVARMYCDPPKWETWVAKWAGEFGDKRVREWWTNRRKPMAYAIRSYKTAIDTGELSHDGDKTFEEHVGNARQQPTGLVDEEEKPLWILRKERPDSPLKIDGAVAGVISWEARNDAITANETAPGEPTISFLRFGA